MSPLARILGPMALLSLLSPLPGATWVHDPLDYQAPVAAPLHVLEYRSSDGDPLNYHRPEVRTIPNHVLEVTGRLTDPHVLELPLRGSGPPGYP